MGWLLRGCKPVWSVDLLVGLPARWRSYAGAILPRVVRRRTGRPRGSGSVRLSYGSYMCRVGNRCAVWVAWNPNPKSGRAVRVQLLCSCLIRRKVRIKPARIKNIAPETQFSVPVRRRNPVPESPLLSGAFYDFTLAETDSARVKIIIGSGPDPIFPSEASPLPQVVRLYVSLAAGARERPGAYRFFILATKPSYSVLSEAISSRTLWIFSARHALAPQKA